MQITASNFTYTPEKRLALVLITTNTETQNKSLTMLANGFKKWYNNSDLQKAPNQGAEQIAKFEKRAFPCQKK